MSMKYIWYIYIYISLEVVYPKKVISVVVWIHPGPGGAWSTSFCEGLELATPLAQWQFLANSENWFANENHFVMNLFCKRGCNSLYSYITKWTLKSIHVLLTNIWGVFMCFMELWVLKSSNSKLWINVRAGINPATEVNHFNLWFFQV